MRSNRSRPCFPFTALVAQDQMKLALLLNAINPRLGGVLIRGQKGTAKSTAVRALANLLPDLTVVEGCPYSCDPTAVAAMCDDCAERFARGDPMPARRRPVQIVELPIGATEDRVVGTLDLERAIQEGQRRFEPGLLARANRGILSIDEVNLLQDHLVDTLLDVAAMGRNYVEREGVSVDHPAAFLLVGTMNPEEGDLRPQLLDRFALMVEVQGLLDPAERVEVVRRRIAFEQDPLAFASAWADAEARERERLRQAALLLPRVTLADDLLTLIGQICAAFEVDGLRADIVMHRTATTLAALAGRTHVTIEDIRQAAELALPHRKRRQPFDQAQMDHEQLEQILSQHAGAAVPTGDDGAVPPQPSGNDGAPSPDSTGEEGDGGGAPPAGADQQPPAAGSSAAPAPDRAASAAPFPITAPAGPSRAARVAPAMRVQPGRRRTAADTSGRGAYVGSRLPTGPVRRLALAPTVRAAAPYQRQRRQQPLLHPAPGGRPAPVDGSARRYELRATDVRERVHHDRVGSLVLFLLDASGSMGAGERMAATKGAIMSLLLDCYRKRDRVCLMVFRDRNVRLVLPPTNSTDRAERLLSALPTGGRTPLAPALYGAAALLDRLAVQGEACLPLLVLISDGRANVGSTGSTPAAAALGAAQHIRERVIRWGGQVLVVDTETGRTRLGVARELATAMAARYTSLDELQVGVGAATRALDSSVRSLLAGSRSPGYRLALR